MVYVRSDMAGMACTEHAMRVVPDVEKILPGYLYAYLSSKFGVTLVISGTYGSIIQGIEPQHLADLPVPRLGADIEEKVHKI
ncbi:MAG: restriction endonuclease subunit S domain-containing protein, partial [Nostoc sp.]